MSFVHLSAFDKITHRSDRDVLDLGISDVENEKRDPIDRATRRIVSPIRP